MKQLIICVLAALMFACSKGDKVGYILIQKVYLKFDYKKELEAKFKMVNEKRASILDSMELELKVLYGQLQQSTPDEKQLALFKVRKKEFLEKKNLFEEENAQMSKQFDEQIIKQLNQYVKNYGDENGYKFIYGSDGSGNIMYADSTLDISDKIVEYINKQYSGGSGK